jgi:hypothetical protein
MGASIVLSEDELLFWYRRLELSESARSLIDSIRSSEPVRRVGGGASNVVGRYPSKKMGRIIQFESHRVELAFVLEFEHDPNVLEYYDQPCQIPMQYSSRTGRQVSTRHTPDYFMLRTDSAGWEECKTDAELAKLTEKCPYRFARNGNGTWQCLPGETYANTLGLYYGSGIRGRSAGHFSEISTFCRTICEAMGPGTIARGERCFLLVRGAIVGSCWVLWLTTAIPPTRATVSIP